MWNAVLILGGTGGVGFACAKKFAEKGYDIILVCRGRRSKKEEYDFKIKTLQEYGVSVDVVKGNIVTEECMQKVLDLIGNRTIFAMVHAVADGNIGSLFGREKVLNEDSFLYTLNTMCISFITWTQVLVSRNILYHGSCVIGFSSEGFYHVVPQYAANALAKAALETLCMYMVDELNKNGISVFVFRTKMVDTNAIRHFDCYEELKATIIKQNLDKQTTPEEIANQVNYVIEEHIAGRVNCGVINLCHNDD